MDELERFPGTCLGPIFVDFDELPTEVLVKVSLIAVDLGPSAPGVKPLVSAVLKVAERRGWPDGWREDPSVLDGLAPTTSSSRTTTSPR